MKRLIGFILTLLLSVTLYANGFNKEVKFKDFDIVLISQKPIAVGDNEFIFDIKRANNPLKAKEVKVKFFMPAMPGMPYMEYKADAKSIEDGKYKAKVNLSMRGTWQLHIFITTQDGKKYRIKSSINF